MPDFRRIQNGSLRQFARARSIAGRQDERMSMGQYAAQRSSQNTARNPQPTDSTHASRSLFRPPSSFDHLFPKEPEEVEATTNHDSTHSIIDLVSEGKEEGNAAEQIGTPNVMPALVGTNSQSQPCTTAPTDAESEAWLSLRLSQEEDKKKRTQFVDWPPPTRQPDLMARPAKLPSPNPPQSVPVAQNTRRTNRWAIPASWTPHSSILVNKDYSKSVERVEAVGKALERFVKVADLTPRLQTDIVVYEQCKLKTDNRMSLSAPERKRLGDILRSIEHKEYSMSIKRLVKQKNSGEEPAKPDQNSDPTIMRNPRGTNKVISTPNRPSPLPIPSTRAKQAGDDTPEAEAVSPQNKPDGGEATTSSQLVVDDSDDEDYEHKEEFESEQTHRTPEPLWLYSVYRSDFGGPRAAEEPTLISSHFSKRKAEDAMRQAVRSCYGSITDRTRIEFHAIIDEDFQEQVVELASGRSTVVKIEQELVEEETPRKRRKKLHRIPTKLYAVIEKVLALSEDISSPNPPGSFLDSNGGVSASTAREAGGCSYRQLSECFVLASDANTAASRLMVSHLTAHLEDDEKFDLDTTGDMDTAARQYLHELEEGGRLFDKENVLPAGKDGKAKKVSIQVVEQLVRGPRN